MQYATPDARGVPLAPGRVPADPTAGATRRPTRRGPVPLERARAGAAPITPLPQAVAARPGTETEKVYEYAPGQVYKVTVALDAPLDVILEAGEKVQTVLDSDPKPIVQGPARAGEWHAEA